MLDIICEKCKGKARLNNDLTTKHYVKHMELLVVAGNKITGKKPNCFYYTCRNCNTDYRLNTKELLSKIQDVIIINAFKIRQEESAKSEIGYKADEKNGVVYCGQCPGLDGDGNCFKDSYNRCSMRIK